MQRRWFLCLPFARCMAPFTWVAICRIYVCFCVCFCRNISCQLTASVWQMRPAVQPPMQLITSWLHIVLTANLHALCQLILSFTRMLYVLLNGCGGDLYGMRGDGTCCARSYTEEAGTKFMGDPWCWGLKWRGKLQGWDKPQACGLTTCLVHPLQSVEFCLYSGQWSTFMATLLCAVTLCFVG